jgi:hypothetical protein
VDHDLLAFECRVEVRHDADTPAGCVRRTAVGRHREDLGRRPVLAPLAERAALELLGGLGLDLADAASGTTGARGSERDEASRERVASQEPELDFSRNGFSRSIGAGKTIVVDADELTSISVWR